VSPTYQAEPVFTRDYGRLTPDQRRRFLVAVAQMVDDMKSGRPFRPGLRVKRVQGADDVGNDVGAGRAGDVAVRT
jgi:hypothetical protein